MERRTFIKLSSFTASAIYITQFESCKPGAQTITLSQPQFFSHFVNEDVIKQAGANYLKLVPAESNKEKLISVLMENVSAASSDIVALESAMDKKIQNDFDNRNTIIVNGWILSVTEARQCALFSLI